MHTLCYVILVILFISNDGEAKPNRIIEGLVVTSRSQFPFYVQLRLTYYHNRNKQPGLLCGSTLIHPQWILSAGHCFEVFIDQIPQLAKEGKLKAYAGTTKRYDDQDAYLNYIVEVVMHPNFKHTIEPDSDEDIVYDVAVAKLRNEYIINEYVRPASLPKFRKLNDKRTKRCKTGIIVGVGVQNYDPSINPSMKQFNDTVKYAIVEAKSMKELKYPIDPPLANTVFYSQDELSKGFGYDGDSGGPFTCLYRKKNPVVYGVISTFLLYKANGVPIGNNIFEEVEKHMDFISSTIKSRLSTGSIGAESKQRNPKVEAQKSSADTNELSFYCIRLYFIFGVIKNVI